MTYHIDMTIPEWAVGLFLFGFLVLVAAMVIGMWPERKR